jgi:hypothetical protein
VWHRNLQKSVDVVVARYGVRATTTSIGKKENEKGDLRIDVPVFVVVLLLPNPPKVEAVLLFWPKAPPPPPKNDMVGDVD